VKKKIGVVAILSLVIVIGLLFLSTGGKIAGVMISDYSISEKGDSMSLEVGLASKFLFQEA
jgi:hypothetical protein